MSTVQPAPPFRNRRGGLVFFGIVELLFGIAAGSMALLVAATLLIPGTNGGRAVPVQTIAGAVPLYLAISVVFFILGVGSIMARRWARALTLAISWMWMITGLLTGVAMVAMSGAMLDALPPDQGGARAFVIGCMAVMMGVFGGIVPLIFILFYRSPNVRATVEALDPVPRWTDRVPTAVLVFACWMFLGGISMLVWGGAYPSIPIGNWIVERPVSIVVMLFFAAVSLFIAIGSLRLLPAAWWAALALFAWGAAYSLILLPRTDLATWYESAGLAADPKAMEMVRAMYSGPFASIWLGVLWFAYLGFLLYIRRYFFARRSTAPV